MIVDLKAGRRRTRPPLGEHKMREFKYLDPLSLKAFYSAATTLHFTRAAQACNMTQSGVSQHIARLEADLGVDLFVRTGRSVSLSEAGQKLKVYVETFLDQTDGILELLQAEKQAPSGKVRYAMPASCLMTPHFSRLLEQRPQFENIDLAVTICHSEEVMRLLSENKIDFGFVTRWFDSPDIQLTEFSREEYLLVAADPRELKFTDPQELLQKKFILYPGMPELYERWFESCFGRRRPVHPDQLNITGEINNLPAAINMVAHGLGLGVFPQHCVQAELSARRLHAQNLRAKSHDTYPIYIARRKSSRPLKRVQAILDIFMKMKTAG